MKNLLIILMCLFMCGCVTITKKETKPIDQYSYKEGYLDGYQSGYWDGYNNGKRFGYAWGHFDGGIKQLLKHLERQNEKN